MKSCAPEAACEAECFGDIDLSQVDAAVARIGRRREHLIPLLQALQGIWNWLPPSALERLAAITEITPGDISGVSTFYHMFRHEPVGRHVIKTCMGTACHVNGAEPLHETLRAHLRIPAGQNTDAEGVFTVERVACLGCCMLAPVLQIDEIIYGHVETWKVPDLLRDFLATTNAGARGEQAALAEEGENWGEARICLCSSCIAGGSGEVHVELRKLVEELRLPARIKTVGCTGIAHQAPLVEVDPRNGHRYRYGQVKAADCRKLLLGHFQPATWLRRMGARVFGMLESVLVGENAAGPPPVRYAADIRNPIARSGDDAQQRIVTEHAGLLRPLNLDDYLRHDGFKALELCLHTLDERRIIEVIEESGLRGRGGAGFPTGKKWAVARAANGSGKLIVCNGDEGDPGAFMDRMVLESFPFRVIEGMAIAARAISAEEGILYIRAEYPLATERMREAIHVCESRGWLGEHVARTNVRLRLRVVEGAGAFVCGEETALMAAIEGQRGMPRFRPPFPAESGLWGRPTLINNVETFAAVPWIIRNGAGAFRNFGTERSPGSKTFALAGKIMHGGLIEVPMGMTIHDIVFGLGGGIPGGRKLKAVLMGGPSGGCVPACLAHTPVDFEALRAVGAIMGSGGMVVLDESDCMVDIARYFMAFCQSESCGKCTHCRIGTLRMKEILDRFCTGQARSGDLEKLEALAELTIDGSLCGLGKTAPNPVRSSLRYFRSEYEAHMRGECPAGKCKTLIQYRVGDGCIGCTRCAQYCPSGAIAMNPYFPHAIEEPRCTRCDVCRQVCPVNVIEITPLPRNTVPLAGTQIELQQPVVA